MRTLHAYLVRQVLATLVMTVAVFTFILMLGNLLSEILTLLVNRLATPLVVVQALGLLMPFVLAFALPMGLLTATLLVFGRFSADQELTAARASGVSLLTLVSPVLLLGVAFSGLCALFNMQIAPQCRVAYKELLSRAGSQQSLALVSEGQFVRDFPGYILYVGRKHANELEDLWVCKLAANEQVDSYLRAPRGRLTTDPATQRMTLTLQDYASTSLVDGKWHPNQGDEVIMQLPIKPVAERSKEPKLSDMTFTQLQDKLRQLDELLSRGQPRGTAARRSDLLPVGKLNFDPTTPVLVQLHRQVAFSFASISFTLIGIPLGIRAHRRETSAGVAMALVLVLVYYGFIVLSQSLDTRSAWAPHLLVWLPNFIFQAAGAVLLRRANRGA